MHNLINPIEELIERYKKEGKVIPIDIEERNKEIQRINQYMIEMDYTNYGE